MTDEEYIEAEIVEDDYTQQYFAETTRAGRPPRSWDFFLTLFFAILMLVLTVLFVVLGLGFGFSTIGSADSTVTCNYNLISFGSLVVIVGSPIVALIGLVLTIVWIARRKVTFWIPLLASLIAVAIFMLGSYLVGLAV